MRPARKPAQSVVGSAGRGSRSWAEELLAVAAAEQEDEPLQVTVQFVQAVGGVANELCQRGAEAAGVTVQPFAEELPVTIFCTASRARLRHASAAPQPGRSAGDAKRPRRSA